jgi:triosephosphate isomerase
VKPDGVADILSQPNIDGGLVGGASLKADQFISIIEQAAKIKK